MKIPQQGSRLAGFNLQVNPTARTEEIDLSLIDWRGWYRAFFLAILLKKLRLMSKLLLVYLERRHGPSLQPYPSKIYCYSGSSVVKSFPHKAKRLPATPADLWKRNNHTLYQPLLLVDASLT
ncbi:hypothetical protein J6590_079852 [Homalodisca vitripennis]|nr:hypothetical protein J6590_079852 [Homalodisca vitripennis]